MTEKYFAFKTIISKYLNVPDIQVANSTKSKYGLVEMKYVSTIFDAKDILLTFHNKSENPMTFEDLDVVSTCTDTKISV